jgi:hypothetical protein
MSAHSGRSPAAIRSETGDGAAPFSSSIEHLLAELERIDFLVREFTGRLRNGGLDQTELRSIVVSDVEVERFLNRPPGLGGPPHGDGWHLARAAEQERLRQIEERVRETRLPLRLERLAGYFGLVRAEVDALLVCIAPELDPEYGRQFGYIHDDLTRRQASLGLVLALFSDNLSAALAARSQLSRSSPLFRWRLLQAPEAPSHAQFELERPLVVDSRVLAYLLGSNDPDAALDGFATLPPLDAVLDDLVLGDTAAAGVRAAADKLTSGSARCIWIRGPADAGKRTTAAALAHAAGVCLLLADSRRFAALPDAELETRTRILYREAVLQQAAVCWHKFEEIVSEEKPDRARVLTSIMRQQGQPTLFLSASEIPARAFEDLQMPDLELPMPAAPERERLWRRYLGGVDGDLVTLATQFRFYPGQIRRAAEMALDGIPDRPRVEDVWRACRHQTHMQVKALAQKVHCRGDWEDLILPADRKIQLRELCNSVRYRGLVYDTWGMATRIPYGRGVNALFSGPPGTGKTMAASLIAGELGLDLYRIDLAGVVSKYIGETEKNLQRIFAQADGANLVLFFDEADALFGKRTGIRDSHDRFANIEIGYLLQKIEEHEGVVILATNLRRNLDEAFLRRFQYTVEFPFPGERERLRMWEQIWPRDIKLDASVDPRYLARAFEFSGGSIRNVAVTAAFLAASDGGVVAAEHLAKAVQREFQKMGKIVLDVDGES